jgi:hypothetical protein
VKKSQLDTTLARQISTAKLLGCRKKKLVQLNCLDAEREKGIKPWPNFSTVNRKPKEVVLKVETLPTNHGFGRNAKGILRKIPSEVSIETGVIQHFIALIHWRFGISWNRTQTGCGVCRMIPGAPLSPPHCPIS